MWFFVLYKYLVLNSYVSLPQLTSIGSTIQLWQPVDGCLQQDNMTRRRLGSFVGSGMLVAGCRDSRRVSSTRQYSLDYVLHGLDSTLIWNAWLDEDLAWLDAFGEPAVSAIHTCWCCGRGTLPGDIWYNTRTGWYDLPYEPGKFLPLHMIHELSNFRVGKNNNTLSRSYFTL